VKTIDRQIRLALALLGALVFAGTLGYVIVEDYTLGEGLYMTVITITTVGFGEVKPLSPAGRMLTTVLIFLGFINLAFVGHAFLETFFAKILNSSTARKKMLQQIQALQSHYIICGFGRVGAAAVRHFCELDVDFVVIDANPERCQELHESGILYLEGDAIDEEVLQLAGIKRASGLMTLLPSTPDNLFITLTARELNPTLHIIARADNEASERKLIRAGADEVISPYKTAGVQMAVQMLSATGDLSLQALTAPVARPALQWIEVKDDSDLIGKRLAEVMEKQRFRILGLRRRKKDSLFPEDHLEIRAGDKLLILKNIDEAPSPAQAASRKQQKVVLVDDNPVVLRLYARLMRRAGFVPFTANNGRDAVDLILREKPVAAVIDYMLPLLSGIEVCRRVRGAEDTRGTKLILFTSDEQPDTRVSALEAGADAVVVKSADADELIETVIRMLNEEEQVESRHPVRVVTDSPAESGAENAEAATAGTEPSILDAQPAGTSRGGQTMNPTTPQLFSATELLEMVDGDTELLRDMLTLFEEDSEKWLRAIREAIETGDPETLKQAAHALKGSLASLTAEVLREKAHQLEMMGKNGTTAGAESVYQELASDIQQLQAQLNDFIGSEKTA